MSKLIYVEEKLFYDSYKWEKASYIAYISRVKKNIPFEEAILPWKLERNLKKLKEKWSKYRNDDPTWIFYNNYEWEKLSFRYFKEKVNAWMPMEIAIKKDRKMAQFLKENRYKKNKKSKTVSLSNTDDSFFIKITLSKEEAEIFREIYEERIEENEYKMLSDECDEDMNTLIKENDQLKKELEIFNKWNPL